MARPIGRVSSECAEATMAAANVRRLGTGYLDPPQDVASGPSCGNHRSSLSAFPRGPV